MRETEELPALTVNNRPTPILLGLILFLVAGLAASGCRFRRTTEIKVPAKILMAKTASIDALLNIINGYEKIGDLSSSSLRATLTLSKRQSGLQDEYPNYPGYILLRRPDSTLLVIQNPITRTAELSVLSVGDDLKVWVHGKNRLYEGKNSSKELVAEDLPDSPDIPIRATHIFEAILPQSIKLESPQTRISVEEEADAGAKYYVISVYKEGTAPRIHTIRRIWIERSELTIARQQLFLEDGQVAGDIAYLNMEQTNGFLLPLKVVMNRPLDGYALGMEFKSKSWRINSNLPDNAFEMKLPEGVQIIHLKEKTRSNAS